MWQIIPRFAQPTGIVRGVMVAMLYLIAPTTLSDVHAPLAFNDVQLVGSARLSVLFWDVYDVQLFTNTGRYDPDQPFLLSIRYLREVTGEDIAERSIAEMKANDAIEATSLAQWTEQLQGLFPDVSKGDQIQGVYDPLEGATFFHNETHLGVISDLQLSRRFFDIWLGERTSKPEIRKQLLGLSTL